MPTSTLNPFNFSGRNLPTETEHYESSVYQTPELNPSLNDSVKHQNANVFGNDQSIGEVTIKKLDYEYDSTNNNNLLSTIAKARPGTLRTGDVDSGSEENIPDSNDSEYGNEAEDNILGNASNPFQQPPYQQREQRKLLMPETQ